MIILSTKLRVGLQQTLATNMVADINNLRVKDNDNQFVIALKLVCRFNGIPTICNFVYPNTSTSFKTQKNFLSSFIKIRKTFFSHQNSQENFPFSSKQSGKKAGKVHEENQLTRIPIQGFDDRKNVKFDKLREKNLIFSSKIEIKFISSSTL
jgi:hypothetical protein